RLPSALDNRPLKFEEFEEKTNQTVYVSATPGHFERGHTKEMREQIIRPTRLLDHKIDVRPVQGQLDDLSGEIHQRTEQDEPAVINTRTKRMAEDLTDYLKEMNIRVAYLH